MIRSNRPLPFTAAFTANRSIHDNRTLVLNAVAGFTATLPAAAGTGAKFRFVVGTTLTSAAYIVKASGTDVMQGAVTVNDIGDSTPALPEMYGTASNTNTFTWTQSIGAGKRGDWFEVEDIATGVWAIRGETQAVTDPTSQLSNT